MHIGRLHTSISINNVVKDGGREILVFLLWSLSYLQIQRRPVLQNRKEIMKVKAMQSKDDAPQGKTNQQSGGIYYININYSGKKSGGVC